MLSGICSSIAKKHYFYTRMRAVSDSEHNSELCCAFGGSAVGCVGLEAAYIERIVECNIICCKHAKSTFALLVYFLHNAKARHVLASALLCVICLPIESEFFYELFE